MYISEETQGTCGTSHVVTSTACVPYLEPFTGTVVCNVLACEVIIAVNPPVAQRDPISTHRFILSGFISDTTKNYCHPYYSRESLQSWPLLSLKYFSEILKIYPR